MFDDEDYGFLTGGLGDLDGDGRVDFTEYINEEDDFQRIMGNNDDDDSFSDNDEEDDDWKDDYSDTADELGLDLDDYSDEDEFLEAVDETTEDTEDDENEDDEEYDEEDEDVDDEESVIPFKDFDISKLSLTIGAHTSLDYDGKPIDEVFGAAQKETADDKISLAEYKKLKNENKALKSKVTQLEKHITDLNYNIQRLEADLEARRKPVKKEWDGKYYRYCQVRLDESRNDLWYRTDDITLKVGNYVIVPYGYKNDEKMGKVVSVEEYRSDDLPLPLEKTKTIIEKCDE